MVTARIEPWLTRSKFVFPSGHFVSNFTLDDSTFNFDNSRRVTLGLRCCSGLLCGIPVNKTPKYCGIAVISNSTVCDVCVFKPTVFGEMKLCAVLRHEENGFVVCLLSGKLLRP